MPAQTVEDNPDAKPLKVYPVPGSGASPTAVKRVELMREDKAGNRYNMVFADGHVQRGIVAKTWQEAFKLGASTRKGGAK
jgi:prepilin-type processing-associated H-X9-DG protein